MSEHGIVERGVVVVSSVVQETVVLQQWDVIEAEVKERCVHHAVSEKCKKCTYDGTGENVMDLMITINCENTALDCGTE